MNLETPFLRNTLVAPIIVSGFSTYTALGLLFYKYSPVAMTTVWWALPQFMQKIVNIMLSIKGARMQIWKSAYMFMFI